MFVYKIIMKISCVSSGSIGQRVTHMCAKWENVSLAQCVSDPFTHMICRFCKSSRLFEIPTLMESRRTDLLIIGISGPLSPYKSACIPSILYVRENQERERNRFCSTLKLIAGLRFRFSASS